MNLPPPYTAFQWTNSTHYDTSPKRYQGLANLTREVTHISKGEKD